MSNRMTAVFFTALGVVLGGTLIGGMAAVFAKESPFRMMHELSQRLKLYAVVSSIGGTFNNLRILEGSIFQGEFSLILQQVLIIICGFLGANIGVWIIRIVTGDLG